VAFSRGDHPFPFKDGRAITDSNIDYVDTWKAMEKLYKSGKAKAIGISNFSKAEVERLLESAEVVPAAHQMELHPWLQQHEFTEWSQSKGINVTAYSPFGNSNPAYDKGKSITKLIEDPTILEIAKKHGKSGAQVALAWGIAHGFSVIPKSKTESRIQQNLQGDFPLTAEDLKKIDGIDKKLRFNDPSKSFGWNFYTDLDGK
jgi:diketogulonate reductase-like aldo/keto reductase